MRVRFAAALAVTTLTAAQALASGVTVPMDEVRTVAFAKAVSTVYVGNPSIADVNMIDARHAFLLGKSFGTTNIIALDSAGHVVSNTIVSVSARQGGTVTLMKGATQTTLSCSGSACEAAPLPGDARFGDVTGDAQKHQDMATKTPATGTGG